MTKNQRLNLITTQQLNIPTIQVNINNKIFLLYSKYNPNRDAKAFAEEAYDKGVEDYLIYGLGLGYHISALEELIKNNGKIYHIYIIECNKDILELAKKY